MDTVQPSTTPEVKKTPAMLETEGHLGEPIEVVLRRLYYEENLTLFAIGARLDINHTTVWYWLRRCGIAAKQLRPPSTSNEAVA